MNFTTHEDAEMIETIHAMQSQEQYYHVTDYLSQFATASSSLSSSSSRIMPPVDASCRELMATWCNDIATTCNYKTETIAITMNCLDRFMGTSIAQHEIMVDRNKYQLAVMVALYSTVKIHEQEAMDPNLVASLSHGVHSSNDVEEMERKILAAIQWRMNPPTIMSFVRILLNLMPVGMGLNAKQIVSDLIEEQITAIAHDYSFACYDASYVAYAALLNSIEICSNSIRMDVSHIKKELGIILKMSDDDFSTIDKLRNKLYTQIGQKYSQSGATMATVSSSTLANTTTKRHSTSSCINATISKQSRKESPTSVRSTSAAQAA